ncbi:MAG: electron transfer flavoprotein subunit beta/FixA family protein [Myxococcota bacterium]|nr:electron transfer flavoprotein subunit beta/FixA family protein [Myxococcota bacterium]
MKIGVCLKQVPATDTRIKIKDPESGVDTAGVKWEINPYDEFALEEALRLKDAKKASKIILFTIGGKDAEQKIREGLARGADAAVRIDDPALAGSDSLGIARALAAAVKAEGVDIVLAGKQAVDGDRAQVPAMIAELLDWPQLLALAKLEVDGQNITGWCNAGGGSRDAVATTLPAVLTADKELNEPRYASLRGIMMAKRKKIAVKKLSDLGVDPGTVGAGAAQVVENSWSLPPQRAGVQMLDGDGADAARELVRLLREDAKVI